MKNRKLCVISLFVVLIIIGVGQTLAQDKPQLTYWDTMNDQERVVFKEIVDQCAADVGVEAVYEYVPFSDAQNNYRTAAQAGNAPDILRTEVAWGPEFAALGYLLDISDPSVVTEPVTNEERATYLEAPFNYNTWGGKIWGLPQVTDAPALLYNKSLFKAAGLDPDNPPKTMDELRDAALKIAATGKSDAPVIGLGLPSAVYFFQPFMWAFGGGLIVPKDDGTYDIQVNNEGSVQALDFVKQMIADGAMGEPGVAYDPANQYTNNMAAFKEGRMGMLLNGPWATADILSGEAFADPDNLGVAPIPAGPAGQGSPVGGHGYTIYAGTQYPNEALALVRCFNNVENQVRLAKELNLVPTLLAAYDDPELAANKILQGFLEQMKVATNRPVLVAGGSIYTEFGPQYDAAILGERSSKEALDNTAAAWKILLQTEPQPPK